MGIDIRFPIGLLFLILGLILLVFGVVSDPSLYQRSLGININLWWGLVLALAGALMLFLSRRSLSGKQDRLAPGPETAGGVTRKAETS